MTTPNVKPNLSKHGKSVLAMLNDELTLADYREIGRVCTERMAAAETETRNEVAERVKELAAKAGLDPDSINLAALFGSKKGSKGSESNIPPKYRNPADYNETWTGRGRMPTWMKAAIEKSGDSLSPESFLIEKQDAD